MNCPGCRQSVLHGSRFCPSCGVELGQAVHAISEERRIVTVIFCDIVGSTALAELLDTEALRAITLRYFDAMRERIQAAGGTVEKFIGDAVMAVFGVPVIHEDDAPRALAAALDMITALDELNVELERVFRIRLQVRIGVNTGEVVAAADVSSGQALVSGDVVNVAARLEQYAAPGQVLIGQDALRAAGKSAVVEDAGLLSLRGKAEPVHAYRLLGLQDDAPELIRRFDTPFVGRKAEFDRLDLILSGVTEQRAARLVTVYGDAGIGKTRLVREWMGRRPSDALLTATGRCRPVAESGTLTPLADVLRQLLHGLPRLASLAGAFAVLDAGLLQDGTPNPSAEDTHAAVTQVLSWLAADQTIVIALDDCQWAQDSLLDLIDRIHQDLVREPLMFVCLGRPELLGRRAEWDGGRLNASSLLLCGLSADEAARLAAELGDVVAHEPGSQASVLERAEGNPLHIEQLIGALEETGQATELPLGLHTLLSARVSALRPCQRTLLQIATVIGREFAASEAIQLLSEELDPLHTCTTEEHRSEFHELIRLRLIEPARHPGGKSCYRFSSGLIYEVTYQGMVKRVRAERHERAANLFKTLNAAPVVVGSHLESAVRYRLDVGLADPRIEALSVAAAAALTRAGAIAMARSDLWWAEDLLERALALTPRARSDWLETARQAGEVRLARGHLTEGGDLLREVLETAVAAGDSRTAMHVRLDLGVVDPDVDLAGLAGLARRALVVFRPAKDSLGIARASIRVGQERQFQGRHAEAMRLLTRALDHAVLAEAEPERAMALGAMGISLWHGPVPAPQAIRDCRALLVRHSDRRAARMSLGFPLAVLYALRGDSAQAAQALAMAEAIGRSTGHAEAALFLPFFSATVETLGGNHDQAESFLRQALAAAHGCGDVGMVGAIELDLARVLTVREADAEAAGLLTAQPAGLQASLAADACGIRGRIAARQGRPEEALALAGEALALAGRTDSPVLLAMSHLDHAHVLASLSRPREAGKAARRAAVLFARKGHSIGVAWVHELLARLDLA